MHVAKVYPLLLAVTDEDKKLSKDLEETCMSLSLALLQKETHKASSLKQNKENERWDILFSKVV